MKILENSLQYSSEITHMLQYVEDTVDTVNRVPYDELNDENLYKAVRRMYNASSYVEDALDKLKTESLDAKESKEPVTEGYIEDRYLEVIKICNGTIDVAESFGHSMNSVNNIRAGIVAIRNDLRSLKSGITGAAEHDCKLNIRDEATIINRDIEKIDAMIGQLQRFKAQAIEAALEAKKVTAGVVVPR